MSYVFGPVPSRRLGRSLGVDLIPFKTCSYDCVYCQLGCTTEKTVCRKEWLPIDDVLAELKDKLVSPPDYITLSGSGEPTLNSRIGEVVERIKAVSDVPLAVLTNGSLLWDEELRRELADADLVVPSLDAGDQETFELVNRPHEDISFEKMLSGLVKFREQFRGDYWLEVFLLAGLNDTDAGVEKIAGIIRKIKPDRVQLNTVTRPPAESFARAVSKERMEGAARMFDPTGEVICDFRAVHRQAAFVAGREAVLDMLRRRPCSLEDIAAGLGMHLNEAVKYVGELTAEDLIEATETESKLYYKAK